MVSRALRSVAMTFVAVLCVVSGSVYSQTGPRRVVVIPRTGLQMWLPQGNLSNENQRGGTVDFDVRWEWDTSTSLQRYLTVDLLLVTSWKGVCGNTGANTLPDLRIEPSINLLWNVSANGLTAQTKQPWDDMVNVPIKVSCFDFAASGQIRGRSIYGIQNSVPITMPADTDGDLLPDVWEVPPYLSKSNPDMDSDGIRDDREDQETYKPGALQPPTGGPIWPAGAETAQGVTGDGLTAWEEYRGFSVKGAHMRLQPWVKDLIVGTNFPEADWARFDLVKAQHIGRVLIARETEINGASSRIVNLNNIGVNGVSHQRAVWVNAAGSDGSMRLGVTYLDVPPSGNPLVSVNAGPNGVCNTTADPKDNQIVAPGQATQPNAPVINTGSDGVPDTLAVGDDVQVLGPRYVALSPNETHSCSIFLQTIWIHSGDPDGYKIGVATTIAHEIGHATHVEHNPNKTIMYDTADYEQNWIFDVIDKAQMRLHLKHP